MRSVTTLTLMLALSTSFSGCGRKKMSDRDTKREQARINAEIKRQELNPATGTFRGTFNQGDELGQEVTLRLEIKDVPDTETGQVDPVLVPVLAGSLRLTFGETDGGEYFSWAVQRADYDASQKRVDLVLANETLKELNLSVHQDGERLEGTWTAPTLSSMGTALLTRVDPLNLQSDTPEVRGVYPGLLVWATHKIYQAAELNLTSEQGPDGFSLKASARLFSGNSTSPESLIVSLEKIDFNPLTRKIILAGTTSDIYFVGTLSDGTVKGVATSKLYGRLGEFNLDRNKRAAKPGGHALLKPLAAGYFGSFTANRDDVRLPPRMLVNLVTFHDPEHPSSMGVSGNLRLYFGDFSSTEFVELAFNHIEYNVFTRSLVAKTGGDVALTLKGSVNQGKMDLKVYDDTLGYVGDYHGETRRPADDAASVAGDYIGINTWESLDAYQKVSLTLSTASTSTGGFKLTAVGRLNFGPEVGGEQLVYALDRVTFDPVTGVVDLRPTASDELVFKGNLGDGKLVGEWRTAQLGRMGTLKLERDAVVAPPPNMLLLGSLKGSYRGTLVSTSDQVNLPERLMIGMVTSPDQDDPRGILLSGNTRLYLGPFDSGDYVEYAFESVQFDFFRRRLTAKLAGDLPLTFKGDVGNDRIDGEVFHDSLGLVGTFEVQK